MQVTDCVNAMAHVVDQADAETGPVHTYNLGTETTTSPNELAEIVNDVLNVELRFDTRVAIGAEPETCRRCVFY